MGKDVHYVLKRGTALTAEEIAMIEAARELPAAYDEDNPEIDPVTTPEQYEALLNAVANRNRHLFRRRELA